MSAEADEIGAFYWTARRKLFPAWDGDTVVPAEQVTVQKEGAIRLLAGEPEAEEAPYGMAVPFIHQRTKYCCLVPNLPS
jgi:hypothetical protein